MHLLRLLAVVGLTALSLGSAFAEENLWPVRVAQTDDAGNVISWEAAGPFIFKKPVPDGGAVSGFRPLFARWTTPDGDIHETNVLYPLFIYRTDTETYRWSVFQLINRSGQRAGSTAKQLPALTYETFDVWPFWFSRDTHDPETSYRALFPIGGTIKSRFGYDRLTFGLFPLFLRSERKGAITTSTPWPFIKRTRGTEQGFALWPLFGTLDRPGEFHRQFYLWPLGWDNTIQPKPDAPAGTAPRREVGFLPFFTRETAPGLINENYVWPFFGYTDRTEPNRYHETRYLWPFLVQGRGDDRYVNRFGPFYTHSIVKGTDKTWVMWPLYREKNWTDAGLAQTQRQIFYFLYRSTEQRSATNPHAAPAHKTFFWPLLSTWDNGAGRRQVQFPSLLEVFFPDNDRIRASWSPLFALYRYDQRSIENVRHELLWGLLTWQREPRHREFHLGPLFSVNERAGEKRIAIGNGLVAWQRSQPGGRWRFFWFDFPSKTKKLRATAR